MKPTMIFALAMLTLIVLMAAFDVHLGNIAPTVHIKPEFSSVALYICPAESSGWDSAADVLRTMRRPLFIGLFFALTMLIFTWGWALYQNLLKDKFNRNSFLKPWGFTKLLFWAWVIVLLAINTPNHYRTVHVRNFPGNYVLCENNTPNQWQDIGDGKWPKAVKYKSVEK